MDNRAKAESQVREYFYNKKQRHDGFYRFGCVGYDHKGNVVLVSIDVRVLLTDEEYLTLLTYQLQYQDDFTFNQLQKFDSELAIKINEAVERQVYNWFYPDHIPFVIFFNEVREDAEKIKYKHFPLKSLMV